MGGELCICRQAAMGMCSVCHLPTCGRHGRVRQDSLVHVLCPQRASYSDEWARSDYLARVEVASSRILQEDIATSVAEAGRAHRAAIARFVDILDRYHGEAAFRVELCELLTVKTTWAERREYRRGYAPQTKAVCGRSWLIDHRVWLFMRGKAYDSYTYDSGPDVVISDDGHFLCRPDGTVPAKPDAHVITIMFTEQEWAERKERLGTWGPNITEISRFLAANSLPGLSDS